MMTKKKAGKEAVWKIDEKKGRREKIAAYVASVVIAFIAGALIGYVVVPVKTTYENVYVPVDVPVEVPTPIYFVWGGGGGTGTSLIIYSVFPAVPYEIFDLQPNQCFKKQGMYFALELSFSVINGFTEPVEGAFTPSLDGVIGASDWDHLVLTLLTLAAENNTMVPAGAIPLYGVLLNGVEVKAGISYTVNPGDNLTAAFYFPREVLLFFLGLDPALWPVDVASTAELTSAGNNLLMELLLMRTGYFQMGYWPYPQVYLVVT